MENNTMKRVVASLLQLILLCSPVLAVAKTPNDPLYSELWYLDQIHAPEAWDRATGDDREVVVAVLDTGVYVDHPDLKDRLWVNADEKPGDGIDNDGNGYIDDVNGWDFVDQDATVEPVIREAYDPTATTHGTLVAGIIGAAGNNGTGITGVSWNVKIMPIRILDALGSGTEAQARMGIEYAMDNGADIINFSLVGNGVNDHFRRVVREAHDAGVIMVASMGNEGANVRGDTDTYPSYPACLQSANGVDYVIGVTASDRSDRKPLFASYGKTCTDVSAPGVDMFGARYVNSALSPFRAQYGGYWEGTSAAAPIVAGAAALLLSQFPGLSPQKMKTVLQLSVDPMFTRGTSHAGRVGAGRINLARALEVAPLFAPRVVRGQTKAPLVFSAPSGEEPVVTIVNAQGQVRQSFYAYDRSRREGLDVAVADIDQDSVPEIVTALRSGQTHVRWFEENGVLSGEFIFDGDAPRIRVGVGDTTGDGTRKIVVATALGAWRVYDLAGNLVDGFQLEDAPSVEFDMAVGDVDGRMGDEVVFVTGEGVMVYGANGKRLHTIGFALSSHRSLALADVNQDGRDELLLSGVDGTILVLNYQGAFLDVFTPSSPMLSPQVAVGDVDADGRMEIILSDREVPHRTEILDGHTLKWFWTPSEDDIPSGAALASWSF